jgi:hypothetical protein
MTRRGRGQSILPAIGWLRRYRREWLGQDLVAGLVALRAAAVFMMAGTTRALRAGMFPRWFALMSYFLAITLVVTVAEVRAVSLIFPVWIGVASVLILLRRERLRTSHEA